MSKKKKENVDTEGLGRLMGIYSYVSGGVFIAYGVLDALGSNPGMIPIFVYLGISTMLLLIKAQKYDGNIFDEKGKLRKGAGKQLAVPIGIAIAALIFTGVLVFYSAQATKVTFLEEGLKIHGLYGEVYSWDAIADVALMEELPNIEMRTNGSALGSQMRGNFRTTELGSVKLFVNAQNPPFIFLQTFEGIVIFNLEDAGKTQEVLEEILKQSDVDK